MPIYHKIIYLITASNHFKKEPHSSNARKLFKWDQQGSKERWIKLIQFKYIILFHPRQTSQITGNGEHHSERKVNSNCQPRMLLKEIISPKVKAILLIHNEEACGQIRIFIEFPGMGDTQMWPKTPVLPKRQFPCQIPILVKCVLTVSIYGMPSIRSPEEFPAFENITSIPSENTTVIEEQSPSTPSVRFTALVR